MTAKETDKIAEKEEVREEEECAQLGGGDAGGDRAKEEEEEIMHNHQCVCWTDCKINSKYSS